MSEHSNAPDSGGEPVPLSARLGPDWWTRVASGVVMAAAAAICLLWGMIPFFVLVVAVALVLSWEWGRLIHGGEADIVVAVHIAAAGAAALLAAFGFVGLGLLALPIGAILAMLLSLGRNSILAAAGVFYAGLPAVAVIWLRADGALGLTAVIFLIIIVVTADTAAFLAGRLIGGPKLWPQLSPNKTWAGLAGALVASALIGALFWLAVPGGSPSRLAVAGAALALVAQAGDLVESALKRRFGAKDTSTLIPGHGGVMDRVDGLVAAAAGVALAALFINVHSPARALLFGS